MGRLITQENGRNRYEGFIWYKYRLRTVLVAVALIQSADRRYVASGHQNGGIYVFSTDTNRILYNLPGHFTFCESDIPGHSDTVRSLSFSPGSNYLAATGDSKVISIYDVQHGEQVANLSGHSSSILSIDWNRTGQLLLSRFFSSVEYRS